MHGTQLKDWREAHGFTQQHIAKLLGLAGNNAVYKIEKGIRKLSKSETLILEEYMRFCDANVQNFDSVDFTEAEMAQLKELSQNDGMHGDVNAWIRKKIKTYLAALRRIKKK